MAESEGFEPLITHSPDFLSGCNYYRLSQYFGAVQIIDLWIFQSSRERLCDLTFTLIVHLLDKIGFIDYPWATFLSVIKNYFATAKIIFERMAIWRSFQELPLARRKQLLMVLLGLFLFGSRISIPIGITKSHRNIPAWCLPISISRLRLEAICLVDGGNDEETTKMVAVIRVSHVIATGVDHSDDRCWLYLHSR
jgi:hypothetical protein